MNVHNRTYLFIGIALILMALIWSVLGWHDRYMYRMGLTIVGVIYIVLAFNKPKENKGVV